MAFQEQTKRVLARYGHGQRTAAWPPFSKHGPPEPPQPGMGEKRNIPKEHPFDPRSLKPMSKSLWACSVSLGHALTAYRHFTRLKSTTVSPDGKIGGRGYVMGMQEIRQNLYDVCEKLSAVSDTLYDEINAPHWKPKLAQLDEDDQEDVARFVEESQEVLENPEEDAEENIKEIEEENDEKGEGAEEGPEKGEEAKGSELPGGGAPEASEVAPGQRTKEARFCTREELRAEGAKADPQVIAEVFERSRKWSEQIRQELEASTLPVETLPGPRVEDWDEGPGPFGSANPPDDATSDEWGLDEGTADDYDYPGERENELSHQAAETWAESVLPSDDTPTEAWDFGLGYGARGQGAGDYANPSDEGSNRGVWGPHSGLPGTPSQSVGDTTPVVDVNLNERHGLGMLPGDTDEPVARRDEYPGPKGNLVQTSGAWAESVLPGGEPAPVEVDQPMDIDTGYVHEDLQTPWLPLEAPGTNLPPATPGTRVE